MRIKFLGAHNVENQSKRLMSLLLDRHLAFDAGSLTSSLSLDEQIELEAVLITHQHYDHIRDLPILGMNLFLCERSLVIYGLASVGLKLEEYFFNGSVYSDFFRKPLELPTLRFYPVSPLKAFKISGYHILPVWVDHSVPTIGYLVSKGSRSFFYSGDTGPGLGEIWRKIRPNLIVIEVTASNRYEKFSCSSKHMTPSLLKTEMIHFRKLNGYLPDVICCHMNPYIEAEIATEVEEISKELKMSISLAYEGMVVDTI